MKRISKIRRGGRPAAAGAAHALAIMSMTVWSLLPANVLLAGPEGAHDIAGDVQINQTGDLTTIHAADNARISWDSFNTTADETVNIHLPGETSRMLNRITGPDPTQFDGTLWSNGIVYIVNPAGVYFGNGAVVNVGGLYAGAANLANNDFINNVNHFTDAAGNVVNAGTINASLVALVGRHVANYGTIHAPNGSVTMVAGNDILLGDRDRHFMVRLEGAAKDVQAGVENAGTIDAEGGTVVWGAGDIYAVGIHQHAAGSVKAAQVHAEATGSNAIIQGEIDASNSTGAGGSVTLTAQHIAVDAIIDASGSTGGGTIRIGGDAHGQGDLAHARSVLVTSASQLIADSAAAGNAGRIIVWSDNATRFHGSARATGGNGFVETSGHYLDTRGALVIAPGGNWLLDPFNVVADDFAASTDGTFNGGAPNTWTPQDNDGTPGAVSQVDVDNVNTSLNAGTGVTINTTGVGDPGQAGNFTINAPITKSAGGNATFTANVDNDLTVNSAVTSTSGELNIDFNVTGIVDINAAITTNGGDFTSDGTNFDNTGGTISTGGGNVNINNSDAITIGSAVATAGGDFTVTFADSYTGTAAVTTSGGAVEITTGGDQMFAAGAIDAGAGNVTLFGINFDEIGDDQLVEITTTGALSISAGRNVGNTADDSVNEDSTPLLDVQAGSIDVTISSGATAANISLKDHTPGGVDVDELSVSNGFIRFDSVGQMRLANDAVRATHPTSGSGFVWLVSNAGIAAQTAASAVKKVTAGTGATVRFDVSGGDIGSGADTLEIDASGLWLLVDQGTFGQPVGGSDEVFITNLRAGIFQVRNLSMDDGNADIRTPGNLSLRPEDGFGNEIAFDGTGDLTLFSTAGDIINETNTDIVADPRIVMNGGSVTLDSANDIGTAASPIVIENFNGITLDASGGAGDIFFGPVLNDIDPATFTDIHISNTSTDTKIDITSDGANIDIDTFKLPAMTSDDTFVINTASGDLDINASSVNVNLGEDMVQEFSTDNGNINLFTNAITNAGEGIVRLDANDAVAAPPGGNILAADVGPHILLGHTELIADFDIGASGSPIEFAGTTEIVLNVDDDVFIDHDGTTDIELFSFAADPAGTPTWLFSDFADETFDEADPDVPAADNIRPFGGDMLINSAVTASAGTSYSFTAKTGDIFVDDNGVEDLDDGIDGRIGGATGGIDAGTGDVSLIAPGGSVLPEFARDADNVRIDADITPDGPLFTAIANTDADGAVEGSIGGDGTGDNFLDVTGARRFILGARDHVGIRGDGQPVELLDLTVDPEGLFVGTPMYAMESFDLSFNFDVESVSGDLIIHDITSTHVFSPEGAGATEGTALSVRTLTGDMTVENIDVLIRGADPLLGRSVTLRADGDGAADGDILLHDNAVTVGDSGGTNGTGVVRLNAAGRIDEAPGHLTSTVKIHTRGAVHLFANNQGGGGMAGIGRGTAAAEDFLDIDAGTLVAQAGMDRSDPALEYPLDVQQVQTANNPGGIFVFDRDSDANGLLVADVDTFIGDIDIRSDGIMEVFDGGVFAGNDDPATPLVNESTLAGNGNVTLVSGNSITESTTDSGSIVTEIIATGDQLVLISGDAIGSPGETSRLDTRAAILAAQVRSGIGGVFILNTEAVTIDDITDPFLGVIDGIMPRGDGVELQITTGSITFDNAGADDVGTPGIDESTAGILNADYIELQAETILLALDSQFTTADDAVVGRISFGQFILGGVEVPVLSTPGDANSLTVNAPNSSVFFTGGAGDSTTGRLGSLDVHAGNFVFIQGNMFTAGGTQEYFAPVIIMVPDTHFDDTGPTRTAGIYFHSTVDASTDIPGEEGLSLTVNRTGADIDSADDPELPLISFAADVGINNPLAYLRLNAFDANTDDDFDDPGDVGAIASGDYRMDVPTLATIVVANRNPDGSLNASSPLDWSAVVLEDFSMGQNEKLTALGSVNIFANANGDLDPGDIAVRLSDLNSTGAVNIDANDADVLLLNAGRTPLAGGVGSPDTGILRPDDANSNGSLDDFEPDMGLDFWVRSGFHINIANDVRLDDDSPGAPLPRWYAVDASTISGTNGLGPNFTLGGFPEVVRDTVNGPVVLDLFPITGDFNLGNVFPFLPGYPELEDYLRLALTRHEFMAELFVLTRDADDAELLRRTQGNASFDELTGSTAGARQVATLNRVREDVVLDVLETYRDLFYVESAGDGDIIYEPRFDQVRATFAEGLRIYRDATGKMPDNPQTFRSFFEQTGEHPPTLEMLNQLRGLYKQMAQLGITDLEWSQALYAISAKIAPTGLSSDMLNQAVLNQPAW